MNPQLWFSNADCSELSILKYKSLSDQTPQTQISIRGKALIQEIMERVQSLPVHGTEMIKPGRKAAKMYLSFSCAGNAFQSVEIIDRKFKTPSGGFLSERSPVEEDLYRDLDALVEPTLNKRMLKIRGHAYRFKDFTIAFTEDTHSPQPAGGPTRGPSSRANYTISKIDSANLISLSIFSGQLPPQPEKFIVGEKIYYLLTYENRAHERLAPKYFEISEKAPARYR